MRPMIITVWSSWHIKLYVRAENVSSRDKNNYKLDRCDYVKNILKIWVGFEEV